MGFVNKSVIIFMVLSLSLTFCAKVQSQSPRIQVSQLLEEIALQYNLSLLYNPDLIPNKTAIIPNKELSIADKLKKILDPLDLSFIIENDQIILRKIRTIMGRVIDKNLGQVLPYANIYTPSNNQWIICDQDGYFEIRSSLDTIELAISYLGYSSKLIYLATLTASQTVNQIYLQTNNEISEILITDQMSDPKEEFYFKGYKGTNLLIKPVHAISSIGGEPDIFQTIFRQTGVNTGADGIGGIHVRGGKSDQNLVLYDGVRVYNPNHALGMFSIFNSNIIKRADFVKSGSSENQSGRLSSVIDIQIKSPDLAKTNKIFQTSTLASQINFETPIIENKLALLLSLRRSHIDPYIKYRSKKDKQNAGVQGEINYHFLDFNSKLIYKINQINHLSFINYIGGDNYWEEEYYDDFSEEYYQSTFSSQNQITSISWSSILSSKSSVKVNLYRSKYLYSSANYDWYFEESEEEEYFDERFFSFQSEVSDIGINVDGFYVTENHRLKFGVQNSFRNYIPTRLDYDDGSLKETYYSGELTEISDNYLESYGFKSIENTVYLTDKPRLTDRLFGKIGVFHTLFRTEDLYYDETSLHQNIHGYLGLQYFTGNNFSYGVQVVKSVQNDHLLTTADAGFPNDIWVPSTSIIDPQKAYQLEIFGSYYLKKSKLSAAIYAKSQKGLILYDQQSNLPSLFELDGDEWENEVEIGGAKSTGIEIEYGYTDDNTSLKCAYTYNITNYEFEGIENGVTFPFLYSIPHTLVVGGNISLTKKWKFSFDWYYSSGRPYSLYEYKYNFSVFDNYIPDINGRIGGINESRTQQNHKLSVSIATKWRWGSIDNHLVLGIQNIYNRRNVLYEYKIEDEPIQAQKGFPVFPMLKYRINI